MDVPKRRLARSPYSLRERVRRALTARYSVRWHMTVILAGVVLSGVVASALFLLLGITWMPARYVLAVISSYLVFFASVRIWLIYVLRPAAARSAATGFDPGNVLDISGGSPAPSGSLPSFHGGGGQFGGGGATVTFGDGPLEADALSAAVADDAGVASSAGSAPSSSGGGWGVPDLDLDLDDGWVILVVFLLLLAVIFGVGIYLVYVAPAILSEAAFQAVLAAGLARSTRRMAAPGWFGGVFKATWFPFALVLAMTAAFGWVSAALCPHGATIVQVFRRCVFPQ